MRMIPGLTGGVCLFFLSFILSSCTDTADLDVEETKELRCISFYSSVNGVSSTVFHVTQSISEQLEDQEEVSLSVYCLPSDFYESFDYKVQTAIALDMDVMIVSDILEDVDTAVLEELRDNDIFVLVVDGKPSDYEQSACIGTDNQSAGVQAARLVAGQEGEYDTGIVATSFRDSNISRSRKERQNGFIEEADRHENLQVEPICICTSDTLEAMQSVREYLSANPQMNVIYCLDSASGVIVSKVLTELEKTEEVYVLCFDNTEQVLQEMKQGGIDAVIVQNTEKIGQECAEFILTLNEETDLENLYQKQIVVPCQILTPDMIEDTEDE